VYLGLASLNQLPVRLRSPGPFPPPYPESGSRFIAGIKVWASIPTQNRPTTVSKETYYSVKRDLLQCQKRPTTVSKETYYSVKRDLLQCQKVHRRNQGLGLHSPFQLPGVELTVVFVIPLGTKCTFFFLKYPLLLLSLLLLTRRRAQRPRQSLLLLANHPPC